MVKNNRKQQKKPRVMFISSTGGHLGELLQLQPLFPRYSYSLVTEKTKTTKSLKQKHKNVGFLVFGSKDHKLSYPFKLLYNCFKSLFLYFKFHPDYVVTTGAHTAGPMCCLARIFGSKVIYIETFANIDTKTITGKLFYQFHIANLFIVQWKDMLKLYPKATYGGWIY